MGPFCEAPGAFVFRIPESPLCLLVCVSFVMQPDASSLDMKRENISYLAPFGNKLVFY